MESDKERLIKREYSIKLIKEVGLSTTITNFQYILDAIWSNVFSSPKIESYVRKRIRTCPGIIASIDTLYGIKELCEIGDYVDTYLLIRKLRDNLFLDLFLFESQKSFERISDNTFDNINLENMDEVIQALYRFNSLCIKTEKSTDELNAISKWKDNLLLKSNDSEKRRYFGFNSYKSYLLENNDIFNECHQKFLEKDFKEMDTKLNDYTHSNSESVLLNKQKPISIIRDIKETLIDLEQLFLVSLFLVDSTLLSSEDYGDYIECNMIPPEGSQYFVNGFILDVFDGIKYANKNLFDFLICHNINSMKINV